MSRRILVVSASTQIARPVDVVGRHFSDVDHHARNRVHRGVEFLPLADSGNERRFRKTVRLLGIPIADEVVLKRLPDGSVVEDSIAGPGAGTRLVSRFRADGPALTSTTVTVEIPVPGVKRLAVPLLRRWAHRQLVRALDEDRRDLEDGRYPE
jgi:hypothetical protein